MSLFDEEANLDLVLEDKLGERQARKIKNKFGKEKSKDKRRIKKN